MARCLIALALVVAACAEPAPPTLADGSVEAALPASIWPDDPALVGEVECPAVDVEVIAQTTVCTAMLDTDPVTVDVVIDETGAATANVREPLFVVAEARDALRDRLRRDLGIDAIAVACERSVVVASDGREIRCDATSGGRMISFDLTLGGAEGEWTLVVQP